MITLDINSSYGKLSTLNTMYWGGFFDKKLKVGSEIEFHTGGDSSVQNTLNNRLSRSPNYNSFKDGVYSIKTDGSVRSGLEICVIGKTVDFLSVFSTYKNISDAMPEQCYIGPACGLHQHVLVNHDNNFNDLEQPVPKIILSNLYALYRIFAPALIWITSNMKVDRDSTIITRFDNFCSHDDLMKFTPVKNPNDFYNQITKEKYRFIKNMCSANGSGINVFHYEARFMDGSLFPASIAAFALMHKNLVMKAVELSEFGILEVKNEDFQTIKLLTNQIRNSGNREARTSNGATEHVWNRIKELGMDFTNFMKSTYKKEDYIGHIILSELNQNPTSLQLRSKKPQTIIKDFQEMVEGYYANLYKKNDKTELIFKDIVLGKTTGISKDQWCYNFTQANQGNYNETKETLSMLELQRQISYDPIIKKYCLVR